MRTRSSARFLPLALAAPAACAHAVNVSPNSMGQVLLYPYYTVQAGQQTLLSVVNNSDASKAAKLRFLEGYNGRTVLELTLFLAPRDIWTANVFALGDAGLSGSGAAILSTDSSCTLPAFADGPLPNGVAYRLFSSDGYSGAAADSGPTGDARTAEGHLEVIAMADLEPGSAVDADIRPLDGGAPPACARAEQDFESGAGTVAPTTGLFGSASVVDVAEGTFFAYNADALDGFTAVALASPPGSGAPTLAAANDAGGAMASARRFVAGNAISAVFPASRAIDAVSAVFAADAIYNEFVWRQDASALSDQALLRRSGIDQRSEGAVRSCFRRARTGNAPGLSCVQVVQTLFDRDTHSSGVGEDYCGFNECPPTPFTPSLCAETNVIQFGPKGALGTGIGTPPQSITPYGRLPLQQGMLKVDLNNGVDPHVLAASSNGDVFNGLPVIGFAATKYINAAVPLSGGGSALANYTAASPHRATANCIDALSHRPCS